MIDMYFTEFSLKEMEINYNTGVTLGKLQL